MFHIEYGKRKKEFYKLENVRIWASIIHHENKVNEFTGFGNVNIKNFFEHFIISEKQRNHIESSYISVSKWSLQSIVNYCSDNWKYISKNIKKSLGFYKNK